MRRVVAVCAPAVFLVAVLAVVGYAARPTPSPTAPSGTARLGPEPGEDVAAYLARVPATPAPDGVRTVALVQLRAELTVPDALAAVDGTAPRTAVLRVALPRVQTALRFVALEDGVPAAATLDNARGRAAQAAAADAGRLAGRAGAVASAEARGLDDSRCPCVLAVLVDGDRAGLAAVARRPAVRAVEAAPPGTVDPALAPLLPEQTTRADPPPDDGPVPGSTG